MTKKNAGFSLVELMVVVGIMAGLLAIAVPNIISWLPDYRLRAAARDAYSNFQRAKLNAVKENNRCAVVFNQNIGGTVFDYVVFEDADLDWNYDAGENILARAIWQNNYNGVAFDPAFGGGTGLVNFTNNGDGLPSFAFRANGVRVDSAANGNDVDIQLINTNGKTRQIRISPAGHIEIN